LRIKTAVSILAMGGALVGLPSWATPEQKLSASGQSEPRTGTPATVLSLAELETQRLNAEFLRKSAKLPRSISPQLLAIHGVGVDLGATVSIDGVAVVLRKGVRQRLSSTGPIVELSSVRAPCVSVAKSSVRHRLCLRDGFR
jgi:hypothetical protein